MSPATTDHMAALKELAKDALTTTHWTSDVYKITQAFQISNVRTEAAMKAYVKTRPDKTTKFQWHGSRHENWLSIAEKGLLIRPAGAITTGAMYGYGIYFSSHARKSIGYCSLRGTHWARGSGNTGLLAVYEVHTGKTLIDNYGNSSHNYRNLQSKGGYDSVLAPADSAVFNEERIVYDPRQCTIRFLVEITHK